MSFLKLPANSVDGTAKLTVVLLYGRESLSLKAIK
jgi:hypothetical protein